MNSCGCQPPHRSFWQQGSARCHHVPKSLHGQPGNIKLEASAIRLEAITSGLEAIASRLEAIARRLEAIAVRLEAIASRLCPQTHWAQHGAGWCSLISELFLLGLADSGLQRCCEGISSVHIHVVHVSIGSPSLNSREKLGVVLARAFPLLKLFLVASFALVVQPGAPSSVLVPSSPSLLATIRNPTSGMTLRARSLADAGRPVSSNWS